MDFTQFQYNMKSIRYRVAQCMYTDFGGEKEKMLFRSRKGLKHCSSLLLQTHYLQQASFYVSDKQLSSSLSFQSPSSSCHTYQHGPLSSTSSPHSHTSSFQDGSYCRYIQIHSLFPRASPSRHSPTQLRHNQSHHCIIPWASSPHQPLILNRTLSSFSSGPYALIQGAEVALDAIHRHTHLPWWAVILCTTLALRACITLPLAVHQMKMAAKQELLFPRLKELQEAALHNVVVRCRKANLSHTQANKEFQKEAKKIAAKLFREEGCSPYKLFLMPWVQIPLWITLSITIRNMTGFFPSYTPFCEGTQITLASEGILWFKDLTVVDPYYILPVIVATANLLNIEMHSLSRRQNLTARRRIFTNMLRAVSVAAGYISCQLPTAVVLYWTVSSTSALLQNTLIMLPKSRRMLNIPKVPSEKDKPFRYMLETIYLKAKSFLELQRKK